MEKEVVLAPSSRPQSIIAGTAEQQGLELHHIRRQGKRNKGTSAYCSLTSPAKAQGMALPIVGGSSASINTVKTVLHRDA